MDTLQVISIVVGIVGGTVGTVGGVIGSLSALGVWRIEKRRDEAKLRVTPSQGFLVGGSRLVPRLMVEITNLSQFPVWITDITLVVEQPGEKTAYLFFMDRAALQTMDGEPVRRQLESRRSMSVYFPEDLAAEPSIAYVNKLRVRTDCGLSYVVPSDAIQGYVEQVRNTAPAGR